MSDDPKRPTVLETGLATVAAQTAALAPGDAAAVAVTADNAGVRAGVAVRLGEHTEAAGHVERNYRSGWGWFAGLSARWKRKP